MNWIFIFVFQWTSGTTWNTISVITISNSWNSWRVDDNWIDQSWPVVASRILVSTNHGQSLTCVNQSWPISHMCQPIMANLSHVSTNHGRSLTCVNQSWLISHMCQPIMANLSHVSTNHGRSLSCVNQSWPISHMCQPIMADLFLVLTNHGQCLSSDNESSRSTYFFAIMLWHLKYICSCFYRWLPCLARGGKWPVARGSPEQWTEIISLG